MRLRQSEPVLRSVSRPPPIRSRVVTRDVRFPAVGGCSVWFIPVCSCLLCAAGDLTRPHARAQWASTRTGCLRQAGTVGTHTLARSRARTHTQMRLKAWSRAVLRWQEAEVQQGWRRHLQTSSETNEEAGTGDKRPASRLGVFYQHVCVTWPLSLEQDSGFEVPLKCLASHDPSFCLLFFSVLIGHINDNATVRQA